MLGFNGQYPGPLIQVDEAIDDRRALHQSHRLPDRRALARCAARQPLRRRAARDAGSGAARRLVRLPRALPAMPGIYWYHPHHREDVLQDLGLYGNLLVRSRDPGLLRAGQPRRSPDARRPARRRSRADRLRPRGADARVDGTLRQRAARQRRAAVGRRACAAARSCGSSSPTSRARASSTCRWQGARDAHEGRGLGSRPLRTGSLGRQRHHRARRALRGRRALRRARRGQRWSIACARSITSRRDSSRRRTSLGVGARRRRRARRPITPRRSTGLRRNADVAAEIDRYRPQFERPVDHELSITLETGDLPFPLRPLMNFESVYRHPVEWSGTMPEMDWVATGRDGAMDPARARRPAARTWTSTGASASATSSSCGW